MEPVERAGQTSETAKAEGADPQAVPRSRGLSPALVVLLTLTAGVVAGLALGAAAPLPMPGPGPRGGFPRFESHADIDILLSTVSIALLGVLLAVYIRTYTQTKANFAAGLVVVLLALLLQSVVSSPVLIGAFGQPFGALGTFFLVADIFKSVAFALFLYLSLQ